MHNMLAAALHEPLDSIYHAIDVQQCRIARLSQTAGGRFIAASVHGFPRSLPAIAAHCTRLTRLVLFGCERLRDVGVASLASLKDLRHLDVCGARAGDAGMLVVISLLSTVGKPVDVLTLTFLFNCEILFPCRLFAPTSMESAYDVFILPPICPSCGACICPPQIVLSMPTCNTPSHSLQASAR